MRKVTLFLSIFILCCLKSNCKELNEKRFELCNLCQFQCTLPCCFNSECVNTKWYFEKNENWLPIEYQGNLTLFGVSKQDEGNYKCEYYVNGSLIVNHIEMEVTKNINCRFNPFPNKPIQYYSKSSPQPRLTFECSVKMRNSDECDSRCSGTYAYWYVGKLNVTSKYPNNNYRLPEFVRIPDRINDTEPSDDTKLIYAKRVSVSQAYVYLIVNNPTEKSIADYQCCTQTRSKEYKCSDILEYDRKDPDYSKLIIASSAATLGFIIFVGILIFYFRYKIVIFRNKYLLRNYQEGNKQNAFFILYERYEDYQPSDLINIAQECRTQLANRWRVGVTYFDSDHTGRKIRQDKQWLIENCYVVIVLVTEHYLKHTELLQEDINLCMYDVQMGWPKIIFLLVDIEKNYFRKFLIENSAIDIYEKIKKKTVKLFSLKNVSKWPFSNQFCNLGFSSGGSYDWLTSYLPGKAFDEKEKHFADLTVFKEQLSVDKDRNEDKTNPIYLRSVSTEPFF